MKKLIRHAYYFAAAAALGAMAIAAMYVLHPPYWKPYTAAIMAVDLLAIFLLGNAVRNIKSARLIIENQILHIQPAVFQQGSVIISNASQSIEVFVSCFGILLDSKIIKFNQGGIRLKTVELGRDSISLSYGIDQKTQCMTLLHAEMNDGMLAEIVRKFRYETGVVPTIIH